MTRSQPNISDQLLKLDRRELAGREEYERNLQTLFDQRLSPADWARLLIMGVGGLAGAAVCGMLAVTESAAPARTRVALAALAMIGLSWAALAGVVFRRGRIHSAVHGGAAATMGFAFSLLTVAAIGVLSLSNPARPASAAGLALLPVAVLVLAAVVLVVHHLRQSELRLRRDLLGIEYRLARILEEQEAKGTARP